MDQSASSGFLGGRAELDAGDGPETCTHTVMKMSGGRFDMRMAMLHVPQRPLSWFSSAGKSNREISEALTKAAKQDSDFKFVAETDGGLLFEQHSEGETMLIIVPGVLIVQEEGGRPTSEAIVIASVTYADSSPDDRIAFLRPAAESIGAAIVRDAKYLN